MCHHAGVPLTILRPHNVYGPRMGLDHAIPEHLQRAHAADPGARLEVTSMDHRRTFCHVEDAVEMIWRAASAPAPLPRHDEDPRAHRLRATRRARGRDPAHDWYREHVFDVPDA
jgi:nucleoside-diphosphate-sugar epimerase